MGNCQAAEAATVIIQRPPPNNKIQRIYWSVTANEIMNSNPGHYVAIILTSKTHNGNQLKLLRPHDSLLIGHVYRLVSFEDVLKEFASRKCVKLGKLLKERRGLGSNPHVSQTKNSSLVQVEEQQVGGRIGGGLGSNQGLGSNHAYAYGGHWKPSLQTISEIGA